MDLRELFQNVKSLTDSFGVKAVYGEPVTIEGKTIVPVARVTYGFIGGFNTRSESTPSQAHGAAGCLGSPAGYIENTPAGTRFVVYPQRNKVIGALMLGTFIGFVATRGRRPRTR
ncbi:MAG: GerW family sporulation protein [Pyrinomonadaceae bacterium]